MTYLQLVQSVLKRLRENASISTVQANDYSLLIGEFINDAKYEVENAWDWSHLRTTVTIETVPETFAYVLTTSGDRIKVLNAVNDTSNWFLKYETADKFTDHYLNATQVRTGSPEYYSFNGLTTAGDSIVEVFPKPDLAYTLRFNIVARPNQLTNDDDILFAPAQPVIMLAWAKAIEERGEDGGTSSMNAYATAQRYLNDAVAIDVAKHPEETIWYTV